MLENEKLFRARLVEAVRELYADMLRERWSHEQALALIVSECRCLVEDYDGRRVPSPVLFARMLGIGK